MRVLVDEELSRAQDLNPATVCIRILIAEAGRSYARLHETIKMEKGPVSKICDLSTGRLGLPQFLPRQTNKCPGIDYRFLSGIVRLMSL